MTAELKPEQSSEKNVFGIPPLIQLMNGSGQVENHPKYSPYIADIEGEQLKEVYRQMKITRRFDDEATALQRQGQMALWAPSRGQEAAQIGSAWGLEPNDYVVPSYREHALAFARGVKFTEIARFFRGADTCPWDIKAHNFHAYTLVLAAQVPHAVGYAMGLSLDREVEEQTGEKQVGQGQATDPSTDKKTPAVAVYFGDGSSTEGEAHESMVFAASYNAPILFFVQNNQWAISVPFSTQSRVPLATRAAGYGMEGIRVDGNDVLAVAAVTRYAMEKIRAGEGPVLIEAETYRLGAHTTADDPTKYRTDQELQERTLLDPLVRLEKHLRENGIADDAFFAQIDDEANEISREARTVALAAEPDAFESNFDQAYAAPHAQTEADRQFYREYNAGFEEE
ncbi:MAG: thiamine pyrophosphate-dependent enzyme [Rothia sp. (in: high G+C Gram-positive bacteria)]|nr:thiamine pyrophosphate-dependent enzyme [Rothia sp. (in: high G+C Gram-positive bacteria)]